MNLRVKVRGDGKNADQWTRMREDKLRSMKKALYYSYQAAIVQKYNPNEKDDEQSSPYFRSLINHDKLKVDYEDKILSIPYEENSVSIDPIIDNEDKLETNFHNGTVFKWVHGNKEEWVPDTYWIVYMQYSEETAYFRGEIRKADEEITIVKVNPDGSEEEQTYRGWMTGPDEKNILWHTKKNVSWNDLNYSKMLFITKDQTTLAFFKRFDRVIINGKPWEVQAYNDNYGTSSKNTDSGIIRVALKETYTSTDQQIKRADAVKAEIQGPEVLSPFDAGIVYMGSAGAVWDLSAVPQGLIDYTIDDDKLVINVTTTRSYKKGFDIKCGDAVKHITIKSL